MIIWYDLGGAQYCYKIETITSKLYFRYTLLYCIHIYIFGCIVKEMPIEIQTYLLYMLLIIS